jgi:hypothetical protein
MLRIGTMPRIGQLLAAAAAGAAVLTAGSPSIEEFRQTYVLPANGRVAIENPNGDVRIMGWDRDEVHVQAVKRASAPRALEEARIVVAATGGAVSIRTQYASSESEAPANVEYLVMVPRTARIEAARLINGELSIVGVAGGVRASAVNGGIHARRIEGQTELSTVNGRLDADFFRICDAQSISLRSVNGPITLTLPDDVKASVTARNLSGGIRSAYGEPLSSGDAGGQRLKTVIKGGGARIDLHNVNGGISIGGPRPEC